MQAVMKVEVSCGVRERMDRDSVLLCILIQRTETLCREKGKRKWGPLQTIEACCAQYIYYSYTIVV